MTRALDIRKSELSSMEQNMLAVGSETIGSLDPKEATKQLTAIVTFICKDLGLTKVENYAKARFVQIVMKYYDSLTIAEIKLAFELFNLGELDAYVDSIRGEANKAHFGKFSAQYVMKVLTAYNKRKNRLILKLQDKKQNEPQVTIQEKEALFKQHIENIHSEFLKYERTGKEPVFYFPKLVLSTFKQLKIVNSIPQYDSDETGEKSPLIAFSDNMRGGKVYAFYLEKIMLVFDYMIKNKKTIYDYAKYFSQHISTGTGKDNQGQTKRETQ